MDGKQRIIEENKLAIACKKKALQAEHGNRLLIVDDDPYMNNAISSGVLPVLCSSSMSTGIPQRTLRSVVVTADGEREVGTTDNDTSYGYTSAVEHMNSYLGIEQEEEEEPPVVEKKAVVVSKPVVKKNKQPTSVGALITELLG